MSRLTFIVLTCVVSAIFCKPFGRADKWHAVLQFPDGAEGIGIQTVKSLWVDNTNTQAPRIKLTTVSQIDSNSLSYVIRENQMYEVYQNLTTAKCDSFENLNQQDIALLQAVLNFSNGAITYAGQVFQDEVCDMWFNPYTRGDIASMCVNLKGVPISVSVSIYGKVFTAKMTQFTNRFSSSVFNVPKGCNNSPTASERQ